MTTTRVAGRRRRWAALAALAAALVGAAAPARALEAAWSGFATLGHARSDSGHRHQRFIDRDGTLKRDSLLAGQLDLQLAPAWSATVQAKLATMEDRDAGVHARATWAFVAWRPDNDWLLRAGRVRLPIYMHSESLDVGVARDMLRMPHEMYSVSPTNEINGLSATRTALWGDTELALDAVAGTDRTVTRMWISEGVPGLVSPGETYDRLRTRFSGVVLSARRDGLSGRVVVGRAYSRYRDDRPIPVRFPRVELAPGVGYWKVDAALPGPDIEGVRTLRNDVYTAGLEWQFGAGWRLAGEALRITQSGSEVGFDVTGGYLALFKRIGGFTPYASVARQRSGSRMLQWHRRLSQDRLPAGVPDAALVNAAQQATADWLLAIDQRSVALGTSYALSATAKLHAEWMRTAVGQTSSHFDVMPGQAATAGLRVHTTSLSVSVAF